MGLFNWIDETSVYNNETSYVASYTLSRVAKAMDERALVKVVDSISEKIVDDLYPELVKLIDKDVIVREVSTQVSSRVLEKLFSSGKGEK